MSKLNSVERLIQKPLHPFKKRVEAVRSLFDKPVILYLCQERCDGQNISHAPLMRKQKPGPRDFIHARVDCIANPLDPTNLNSFPVRSVQINPDSDQQVRIYRDFGTTKCSKMHNPQDVYWNLNRLEIIFHGLKLLPIAIIYGQWHSVG